MTPMLERRELLGAGLFSAAIAGMPGLPRSGEAAPLRLMVVSQPSVPESGRFAATLAATPHAPFALEVGEGLYELLGDWTERRGVIAGLTSDPAAMIARQLLIEAGAAPLLTWRHSYEAGRWIHQVGGEPRQLADSYHAWPAIVARKVLEEVEPTVQGRDRITCLSGHCLLDAGSPGLLVTWAYRFGGGGQ